MFDGVDHAVQPLFVPPKGWPTFAERLRPHLEKMAAQSRGRYTAEDIAQCISDGRFLLWLVLDGPDIACVLLTELVCYPQLRAMRSVALVGHRPRRWMHLHAWVEEKAREFFGCEVMEVFSPPRFEPLFRDTGGWQVSHSFAEKRL